MAEAPRADVELHDLVVQADSEDPERWFEMHKDPPPVQTIWGRVDVARLKRAVQALPPDAWTRPGQEKTNALFAGRAVQMSNSKPGVQSIHLVMSNNKATGVYVFPWWWDAELSPFRELVMEALCTAMAPLGYARLERHLLRVQLARMAPHSTIRRHRDSGHWARDAHRLHIPLLVPDPSKGGGHYFFEVFVPTPSSASDVPMNLTVEEGLAFELNNVLTHRLSVGQDERVHLLVDFVEYEQPPDKIVVLSQGQRCMYVSGSVDCAKSYSIADEVRKELKDRPEMSYTEILRVIYGGTGPSYTKALAAVERDMNSW